MNPTTSPKPHRASGEAAWIGLFLALVACTWWRAHTFAPTLIERSNLPQLWPVVSGKTEPLDCDEAAYAYMGRRMNHGAVLYRDIAENKPPLGYWLFALATAVGGVSEWTIRVMPLPIVLATLGLLWWIARGVSGPFAAILTAFLYALLANDPYVYGNGMQLEQPINLFSTLALALLVRWRRRGGEILLLIAGAAAGAAASIRPTAIVLIPFMLWLIRERAEQGSGQPAYRRFIALFSGFAAIILTCLVILIIQGSLAAARENIVDAARALVADTPAPAHAPPWFLRWLTGNSDPRDGRLPWPFGQTDWLVWWSRGAWPLWAFGTLALATIAVRAPRGDVRRVVAAWLLAAWLQIILPRQYWAHYYLLATPALALGTAIAIADALRAARYRPRAFAVAGLTLGTLAIGATAYIQTRDYLLVPASELTARYKGGRQWIALRDLGQSLRFQAGLWDEHGLHVWGWQSPLYLYSGLDSPSRHFFVNDLIKSHIDKPHPLVDRWKTELLDDLRREPPAFIFCGDHPFEALRAWLESEYTPSRRVPSGPRGEGLWIRRDLHEAAAPAPRRRMLTPGPRAAIPPFRQPRPRPLPGSAAEAPA